MPLVVLIDANASHGSVISQAVGAHAAERQDHNGELFQEFLADNSLALPTTFVDSANPGPQVSWQVAQGQVHRIAYVAVPLQWLSASTAAGPTDDIDVALKKRDHWPVRVDLEVRFVGGPEQWVDRRKPSSTGPPWRTPLRWPPFSVT